ncbi:uncharacterized protein LOC127091737 [Lathyrus oleraceus]|uniref:uncharacterized protein LOC127091737 n=1 Tax=Pisum sativum TaxID=3888 RepID=UPI0021CE56AC|nr:uncharacterized protein LOC127091737 [Pisum sativum]
MGEEEKIVGYVSKVHTHVHLMKGYGETLTDKMIVEKVLCTLTSYFDHVIIAIQESNNLETMKLEDLVGSLETWKKHGSSNKLKGKRDKNQSKKSWSNPQKHKVNDRTSESSKRCEGNSYQKKRREKGVKCYNYEKWGHLAKNYWYKKDNGAITGKNEGVNLASQDSDYSEDMVNMVAVADDHVDSKIWFLDIGCSNHMTGRKVWLTDFDESKKNKVKLADNSSLQAECTNNIVTQRSNESKVMIKDVLYVPGMK